MCHCVYVDFSDHVAIAVLRILVFNYNFESTVDTFEFTVFKQVIRDVRVDPDVINVVPPEGLCDTGSKVRIRLASLYSVYMYIMIYCCL